MTNFITLPNFQVKAFVELVKEFELLPLFHDATARTRRDLTEEEERDLLTRLNTMGKILNPLCKVETKVAGAVQVRRGGPYFQIDKETRIAYNSIEYIPMYSSCHSFTGFVVNAAIWENDSGEVELGLKDTDTLLLGLESDPFLQMGSYV